MRRRAFLGLALFPVAAKAQQSICEHVEVYEGALEIEMHFIDNAYHWRRSFIAGSKIEIDGKTYRVAKYTTIGPDRDGLIDQLVILRRADK